MGFSRAKLRISSNSKAKTTTLEIKDRRDDEWTPCWTLSSAIDFKSYLVIAANTDSHGSPANYHYLHSFMFWDTEGPVEVAKKHKGQYDSAFSEKGKEVKMDSEDLLHLINTDSELAKDADKAMSAYNDQLLAHNTRYAKLIGSVYRNQHLAQEMGASFPSQDFMAELNDKINEFRALQKNFEEHFVKIGRNFKDIVEELRKNATSRSDEWTLGEQEEMVKYQLAMSKDKIMRVNEGMLRSNQFGKALRNSEMLDTMTKFSRHKMEQEMGKGPAAKKAEMTNQFRRWV